MAAPYAGLGSGAPMPPAYCRMFLDARRILGLPEWDVAQRLGTDARTITALETGQLSALPPWPETSRIVTTYLAGLGLDARPVLHSLAQDLATLAASPPQASSSRGVPISPSSATQSGRPQPAPTRATRQATSATGEMASKKIAPPAWVSRLGRTPKAVNSVVNRAARSAASAGRGAARRISGRAGFSGDDQSRRRGKGLRVGLAASVVALVIAAVAQTSVAGSVMTAAAAPLPATLTRAFGRVADMIRVQLAPVRDGLRWIEVEDPRSRRGDKLQTARR